ncbi:MAG TPA: hypothetical protein PKD53_28165 [Chloroflexaceae bacterium]|nr:hypothetical protein [Chloroflexaceae bacterium]
MAPTSCDSTRGAILLTLTNSRRPLQTPEIARHLGRCPECLALRQHLLGLLSPGAGHPPDSCSACQEDLAAYVDLSLSAGARAAAETYPHTWWHLWMCQSCAEVFAQTMTLAAAERRGALPPLPVAPSATAGPRVIGRLAVAPQAVTRLFRARELFGSTIGGDEQLVLDEDESGGYSFQLSVQREPGGTWSVLISVIPPAVVEAVVQVGGATFRAPFDRQGIAQVTGVPAALLRDGGSPIAVSIQDG